MRDIVGGPYHPPLWRCHSTDAKQAKSDRGAPYIYWGYSRWALASTILAFSQHGSKAGSNDRSVNCSSFVHAWPESSGTAAEDCRREGCIRHRLTLAHQRGLVFYGPVQGEKAMTTVIRGIVGGPYHQPLWRCHSTEAKQVAIDRSVNGNNFGAHMAREQ